MSSKFSIAPPLRPPPVCKKVPPLPPIKPGPPTILYATWSYTQYNAEGGIQLESHGTTRLFKVDDQTWSNIIEPTETPNPFVEFGWDPENMLGQAELVINWDNEFGVDLYTDNWPPTTTTPWSFDYPLMHVGGVPGGGELALLVITTAT
jgi:hypothetical protein